MQIFDNEIPPLRDIIIISLINTCDVFRFIFQLDDVAEERIEFICNMDMIGRSIAEAVSHNLAGPLLRRSALSKTIPTVSASCSVQPSCSRREYPRALRGPRGTIRPCVRASTSIQRSHDFSGRARDKSLGAAKWAYVPEGQRLFQRLRESLWRIRSIAIPGWSRPFPTTQVPVLGLLLKQTGESYG